MQRPYENMIKPIAFKRGKESERIKDNSINILKIDLLNKIKPPYRLACWVNGGMSDVLWLEIDEVDSIKILSKVINDSSFSIKIFKRAFNLEAYYPTKEYHSCSFCTAEALSLPYLCIEVFVRTKLEETDPNFEGYILLGGIQIPINACSQYYEENLFYLRNYHIDLEKGLYNNQSAKLGQILIEKRQRPPNTKIYQKCKELPKPLDDKIRSEYMCNIRDLVLQGLHERPLTIFNPDYVSIEMLGYLGAHAGLRPRAYFYRNVLQRFKCTDAWADGWIRFAFYLRCLTLNDINECLSTTSSLKPSKWERVISAIVFAFAFKETRFKWQQDAIYFDDESKPPIYFEYFNDKITSVFGTGDCEDFAFNISSALTYVQRRSKVPNDPSYALLDACTDILQYYIITNALVHAAQPALTLDYKPREGIVYCTTDDVKILSENQQKQDELRMKNYHMTCLVIPKYFFFKMLDDDTQLAQIESYPKWAKEELHVQLAEGTCSIYSDMLVNLTPNKNELNTLYRHAVKHDQAICALTGFNYQTGTIMIGTVIQLATDYLDNDEQTTLYETFTVVNDKDIKGFQELALNYENIKNEKIKLRRSGKIPHIEQSPNLAKILDFEMPPVIYDIPQRDDFLLEFNKLPVISTEIIYQGITCDDQTNIPLLPYNFTWKNRSQYVKPIYVCLDNGCKL